MESELCKTGELRLGAFWNLFGNCGEAPKGFFVRRALTKECYDLEAIASFRDAEPTGIFPWEKVGRQGGK